MKMRSRWPRRWHAWLAVIVALPFVLLAVTGVLFSHSQRLGLRNIPVNVAWLPGYSMDKEGAGPEIRSFVATEDGYLVGTRGGLFRIEPDAVIREAALGKEDVRSLVVSPLGVLAVTADALWLKRAGTWRKIFDGPVLQASGDERTLQLMVRGKGPMISEDIGQTWRAVGTKMRASLAALPSSSGRITAAMLAHDLHTGKAFFGERAEWLWTHFLSITLLFMIGSGLTMWMQRRFRRVPSMRDANVQAAPSPGRTPA
jgi:hypothetical protein